MGGDASNAAFSRRLGARIPIVARAEGRSLSNSPNAAVEREQRVPEMHLAVRLQERATLQGREGGREKWGREQWAMESRAPGLESVRVLARWGEVQVQVQLRRAFPARQRHWTSARQDGMATGIVSASLPRLAQFTSPNKQIPRGKEPAVVHADLRVRIALVSSQAGTGRC